MIAAFEEKARQLRERVDATPEPKASTTKLKAIEDRTAMLSSQSENMPKMLERLNQLDERSKSAQELITSLRDELDAAKETLKPVASPPAQRSRLGSPWPR